MNTRRILALTLTAIYFAVAAGILHGAELHKDATMTGTTTVPSGSTLSVSGALSGTPSGGTLNLGSVTISNIAAISVSVTNDGTGAVPLTLDSWVKSRQVNARDFGAIGDGASHPVSQWLTGGARDRGFANLSAIQAVYPHVASLSDEIDWAAIQAATDTGKWTLIDAGDFRCNRTIGVSTEGQHIWGAGVSTSDNSRGTRIHYTGTSGAAVQFPKAFQIASISTHATAPTVTTTAPHGLTTGEVVILESTTGSTAAPALNGTYFVVTVTSATTFTIQQNPTGGVNVSVAPDANTGEGTPFLIRHSGISGMRITGANAGNPTQGIKLGLGRGGLTAAYTANTWTGSELLIERFGVGIDNYGADGSAIMASAIYGNDTGVRTNSNDALTAFNTDVSDSSIGWHVTGLGARLNIIGGVTSNNDLHGSLVEGAGLKSDGVWYEGSRNGEEAGWHMENNSFANFIFCHRQITDALPFINGGIVRVDFVGCDLDMDYTAANGSAITGHGQQGLVNGLPHTASSYLADGAVTNAKLANSSITIAGSAKALGESITASAILDSISSTRGAVLYRGASGWAARNPGTAGYVWQSNGAGNDPDWAAAGSGTAVQMLYKSTTQQSHTGDTSQTAVASYTMPGGTMGANSALRITAIYTISTAADGSDKYLKIEFGGNVVGEQVFTSTRRLVVQRTIWNRGSVSSQGSYFAADMSAFGSDGANAITTFGVNTANPVNIDFIVKGGNAGDVCNLEFASIELIQ